MEKPTTREDEAAIHAVIEAGAKALRALDADGVMAGCAPDLRTFECHSAFELRGSDAYRAFLEACFPFMRAPMSFEIEDLEIAAACGVGFCHYVARCVATAPDGAEHASVLRVTSGFRKEGGKWLTTHVHISAPFNPMTEKTMLDGKSLTEEDYNEA